MSVAAVDAAAVAASTPLNTETDPIPQQDTTTKFEQKEPQETESGYATASDASSTASSSEASLPRISLTKPHLDHINEQLEGLPAMDILRFAKLMFPNLYQSTAFGLTGLVTIDMLAKLQSESPSSSPVDLIFLDTLYHFQETHDLVSRVGERYPQVALHVFRPYGADTTEAFEALYGERVYETMSELYDYIAKVEPLQRAYDELKVAAVLTGRRRSQGAARDKMPIVEVDAERGVVKINPLAGWSFQQVHDYIKDNNVPYNALLDRGYKSIGDWHSTVPVGEGEDERAGRWKGQQKTECGIHNNKARYAQFSAETKKRDQSQQPQPQQERKKGKEPRLDEASAALENVERQRGESTT